MKLSFRYGVEIWSRARSAILAAAALGAAAVPTSAQETRLTSQLATAEVNQPLYVTHSPGDEQRIFIVEKPGRIRVLRIPSNELLDEPFLDISSRVDDVADRGLLCIAFSPSYAQDGLVFVNYLRQSADVHVVSSFSVSADPDVADPLSEHIIWEFPRPSGHFGGWLGFGPHDGRLYFSSGDCSHPMNPDPEGRSQNPGDPYCGKLLRIDPFQDAFPADPSRNYAIPPDNPFATGGGAAEVWAYGLRNPWRPSFDRGTGDLYIADVGAAMWEEVNVDLAPLAGGRNYGWKCFEGPACFAPQVCDCGALGFTAPIFTYTHEAGCSVTGGYVYRGCAIPDLRGSYFFADYCGGRIRTMRHDGTHTEVRDRSGELNPPGPLFITSISSFGEDARGELYICDIEGGEVFKIVPRQAESGGCGGCPCDWNLFDGLDSQDFFDFLDDFFAGTADFNATQGADSQDLFEFFECFFDGCG